MSKLSEDEVEQLVVAKAAELGTNLLRNNTGGMKGGSLRWGLGNTSKKRNDVIKSSDEIGITVITITPEMVGKTVGVFTAVEVKKEGWTFNPKDLTEVAQKAFIDWVLVRGGIAGFVQSVDDIIKLLKK